MIAFLRAEINHSALIRILNGITPELPGSDAYLHTPAFILFPAIQVVTVKGKKQQFTLSALIPQIRFVKYLNLISHIRLQSSQDTSAGPEPHAIYHNFIL